MAVGSAIVAGLALAYGAVAGERQHSEQRRGQRAQEAAQNAAERDASAQERTAEQEANRARNRQPDLGVLLNDVAQGFRPTQNSVNADRLLLGRPGLLGV